MKLGASHSAMQPPLVPAVRGASSDGDGGLEPGNQGSDPGPLSLKAEVSDSSYHHR